MWVQYVGTVIAEVLTSGRSHLAKTDRLHFKVAAVTFITA